MKLAGLPAVRSALAALAVSMANCTLNPADLELRVKA